MISIAAVCNWLNAQATILAKEARVLLLLAHVLTSLDLSWFQSKGSGFRLLSLYRSLDAISIPGLADE